MGPWLIGIANDGLAADVAADDGASDNERCQRWGRQQHHYKEWGRRLTTRTRKIGPQSMGVADNGVADNGASDDECGG